jgi:hypothetical protein
MRYVAYVDSEEMTYGPTDPDRPPEAPVVLDVEPDDRFEEVVQRAMHAAGFDGFAWWPYFLEDASDPASPLVPYPFVGVAEDGEFVWSWGARDRMTLADLERAREKGFFLGDPYGVWVRRPQGGDSLLPGWEEFLDWVWGFAAGGVFSAGIAVLKKRYKHWQARGATNPISFLDVVPMRKAWKKSDVSELLGLSEEEAVDVLISFGYEEDESDPNRWTVSTDPMRSALRRRIIEDYLHRSMDDEDNESQP